MSYLRKFGNSLLAALRAPARTADPQQSDAAQEAASAEAFPEPDQPKLFDRYFHTTLHRHPDYTERRTDGGKVDTAIKLIAFYLPQFHPISENDQWWGRGFTEWTNVSKSVPQFDGHYQPHLPGELGFYDLRLPEVQQKQAELARLYGVHGFCFYHYWFGGRKLLERPVDLLLQHPDIDINFCLCWANENWTRRWDGLEESILIGQNHSAEDDIAFIVDLARALRDPRYIRVEGKPLVMMYRPKLLPDALATSTRWRARCRDNGIGEIFLVTVQSFDVADPRDIGFDAAAEFPPLNFPLKHITESIAPSNPDFSGTVYDYRVMAAKSNAYDEYDYEIYRAAMPGWDNSARRPGNGHIHFHSSPAEYEGWLRNACKDARASLPESRRFVFVNAWNEWAEGAHLEPDRHHGYAYLDRTAKVLAEFPAARYAPQIEAQAGRIAVVLHLYYTDLWLEINGYLANLPRGFMLFVSLDERADEKVAKKIRACYPAARIYKKENRGRDILPFLDMIADIRQAGCRYLCKIHSKKSLHRENGDAWRADIYGKLLGSVQAISAILDKFAADDKVGMICPAGHLLDVEPFWGANKAAATQLIAEFNLDLPAPNYQFSAGSMFWVRMQAFELLAEMDVGDRFEPEQGQIDGTMAHALERLLCLVAQQRGYVTIDTDSLAPGAGSEKPKGIAAVKDYAYVDGPIE